MRRITFIPAGTMVAIMLLSCSVAFAAGLAHTSRTLGASSATVSRCDTDGVTVTQNLSGSSVASVTIANIASACGSGALSVTVNNGTANSSGTGTVPTGGGSMTVTLGVAVAVKDADQIDVAISGP